MQEMWERIKCFLGFHNWWLWGDMDNPYQHGIWEYCIECLKYRITRK